MLVPSTKRIMMANLENSDGMVPLTRPPLNAAALRNSRLESSLGSDPLSKRDDNDHEKRFESDASLAGIVPLT